MCIRDRYLVARKVGVTFQLLHNYCFGIVNIHGSHGTLLIQKGKTLIQRDAIAVSYTHLDVYKRQFLAQGRLKLIEFKTSTSLFVFSVRADAGDKNPSMKRNNPRKNAESLGNEIVEN